MCHSTYTYVYYILCAHTHGQHIGHDRDDDGIGCIYTNTLDGALLADVVSRHVQHDGPEKRIELLEPNFVFVFLFPIKVLGFKIMI
jgi:hypothetical protein